MGQLNNIATSDDMILHIVNGVGHVSVHIKFKARTFYHSDIDEMDNPCLSKMGTVLKKKKITAAHHILSLVIRIVLFSSL